MQILSCQREEPVGCFYRQPSTDGLFRVLTVLCVAVTRSSCRKQYRKQLSVVGFQDAFFGMCVICLSFRNKESI